MMEKDTNSLAILYELNDSSQQTPNNNRQINDKQQQQMPNFTNARSRSLPLCFFMQRETHVTRAEVQ